MAWYDRIPRKSEVVAESVLKWFLLSSQDLVISPEKGKP